MAKPTRKPTAKKKNPAGKASSGSSNVLPGYRDFLLHPEWTHDVYWSVIHKALLAAVCGVAGLVAGYYRMRAGDLAGAGLCWGGLSLLVSRRIAPSNAEFEFLGRYNHFILHPPAIKAADEAGQAAHAAGAPRQAATQ